MSSFLSANYTPVTIESQVDVPLMSKVLAIKQNKYDTNKALIEQTQAAYNNNLKGLRDSDNAYISARLQEASGIINGYGNRDYSITATKDTLLGNLRSITEDPIVKSAVLNKAKYDQANKEVAEKRKKNDGSYSDGNYQDMLDLAGYNAYMKGEQKDLGELRYNDYVDVRGEKSKLTQDYVTKLLLTPQYLGTDRSNPDYFVDSYGNKVEKETVEKYVNSQLTPKDINQLHIDARQSLGKMDEANYNAYMKEYYVNKNTADGEKVAEAEAWVRNHPEDKDTYNAAIKAQQLQIAENAKKIQSGVFAKDEMYDAYTDTFVKSIAAPYDIHTITKKDVNKVEFEIMDANRKYDLDLRKTLAAEDANKIAAGLTGGTATTVPTTGEEKATTDYQDVKIATKNSVDALDAYLKETNLDGYKNKTPQEQYAYMQNLDVTDPRTVGNNATLLNLTKEFQYAQKGYANIVNSKNDEFKQLVNAKYNEMVGGNINLNNLATTAPLTANLIKSGKKYENLSNAEKAGLAAEFASQAIQFGDVADEDTKDIYRNIIRKNKSALKNSPQILKIIENSTSGEEEPGYFGRIGSAAKGVGGFVADALGAFYQRNIAHPFTSAVQGQEYADEQLAAYEKGLRASIKEDVKNLKSVPQAFVNLNPMTAIPVYLTGRVTNQDSNIMELQSGDLSREGGAKRPIIQAFRDFSSKTNEDIKTQAASYQENLNKNKAFTFSTASKAQVPTAIAIENAIAASKTVDGDSNPIPANDNTYTIYREGDGFKVQYKTGSGNDTAYATAYLQNLPDEVVQKYDLSKQNWINSPLNPKVEVEPKSVRMYSDANKRTQDVEAMYQNGVLTTDMQNVLYSNPANTPFATVAELTDKVVRERGEDFYNKHKQAVDGILNATYIAKPFVNPATQTFQFKLDLGNGIHSPSIDLGAVKDEHQWSLKYRAESLRLKLEKIYSLK